MKCMKCGRENSEDLAFCKYCNNALDGVITSALTRSLENTDDEDGVPKWGTARFNSRTNLILTVRDTQVQFVYDADQTHDLVIGRLDPDTGDSPGVDLQEFDAVNKGVSRQHAAIVRRDGTLSIIDKGSSNGTFLNGQRLIPHQARILRDGDDIRLGHLVLLVRFKRVQ